MKNNINISTVTFVFPNVWKCCKFTYYIYYNINLIKLQEVLKNLLEICKYLFNLLRDFNDFLHCSA